MLNVKTGKQVMGRSAVVHKLNRRWAQVKVPGCGWVRFRLTRDLPSAKTFRVTLKNGQWHVAFAVIPDPIDAPGTGEALGIDRGVKMFTVKERAQTRKHQRRAARAKKDSPEKTAEYAKVAKLKAREGNRRKDWCEKTSTMLARSYDLVRFEKLNIKSMTAKAKAKPDPDQPGQYLKNGRAARAGLNRAILAQGWGLLRQRTEHKAPGRVEDVPAPYTSLRCGACGQALAAGAVGAAGSVIASKYGQPSSSTVWAEGWKSRAGAAASRRRRTVPGS